jgi:Protein of unknown function (DUF3102)
MPNHAEKHLSSLGGQASASLAEHVAKIHRLHKRCIDDLVEIGRRLTECQRLVQHGDWLDWLETEFGWSDRTALNFMRVYDMAVKSEKFSDLNLPISALYLLAAPSTPADVADEIIERAAAGGSNQGRRRQESHQGAQAGAGEQFEH